MRKSFVFVAMVGVLCLSTQVFAINTPQLRITYNPIDTRFVWVSLAAPVEDADAVRLFVALWPDASAGTVLAVDIPTDFVYTAPAITEFDEWLEWDPNFPIYVVPQAYKVIAGEAEWGPTGHIQQIVAGQEVYWQVSDDDRRITMATQVWCWSNGPISTGEVADLHLRSFHDRCRDTVDKAPINEWNWAKFEMHNRLYKGPISLGVAYHERGWLTKTGETYCGDPSATTWGCIAWERNPWARTDDHGQLAHEWVVYRSPFGSVVVPWYDGLPVDNWKPLPTCAAPWE